MGNLILNPHYTTKQIYDLNVSPQETPESGKLFYWLTFENNNVYANFRIAGESTDRKYQITDPISFNPDVTFSDKVKSISYNQEFSKLVYENEIDSFDVPIIGLINDISYNENTNSLVVKKTNASDIYVKLPDDFKKFVQSGSYNETNKTLVLKYNDNNTFSIDVSKMVKSYTAEQSSTINTVIDESNKILADLKISSEVGNQVQVRSDGIYIPPADGIDFSDFALKSDLNSKVDKITGKGLSTNDFTTELKTKLEGLSNYTLPIASSSILGGFKVGEGLRINPETGVLTASVTTAGVTSINELAGNIILEAGKNIEITKNGQSITINSTASGNASLDGLLFKIPKIDDAVVYNLYIEFSKDGTFNSTTTYNTEDSSHRSLFKVFTGQQLIDFPDAGVSIPFSDEIITFDISSIDKSLKYFRFRWNNGFDFGRYGFGKTDGLLQIFDSGSSSSKVEVGTGLSGDGTSGNPLNLDLDSYITTGSISLQGLNIELISDGNFIVKGTSFNIGTSENSIPIVLNGNAQNTAGGVVVLETGNKLPAIDGSQLINLPTSGLSSVSVGSGLTGNGTSSSPIKLDLSNYSTDDSIYVTSKGFTVNAGANNIDFAINEGNNRFRVLVGDVAGTTNQECIFDVSQPYIHLLAHGTSYVGIEVPTINDLKLKIADRSEWSSPNTANGFVILGSDGKIPSNLYEISSGGLNSVSVGLGLTGDGTTENPLKVDLSNYQSNSISLLSPDFIIGGANIKIGTGAGNNIYLNYEDNAPNSNIYVNNHALNTAGGLVLLGSDGKIPEDLYDKGALEPTEIKPLLIELNGTNSSSDRIVVSYDNENYLVTITHNLNSYVNGILFDETGKQAFFGIDYVDNNNISIQFSNSTMPTSTSVWKLYLGTQNYNYVYSNAVQTKTISTKDIVFDPNKSIYVIDVTENTLITFDKSNLNIDENIYTFEIWVKMTNAYTIGFSGNIEWLDEPDLTAGGFYCFVVRFMPTSYYPMSIGDRDAIMSLSYRI